MKKKLTAVALVVCMLAIMLVGASLAYFTDEDYAKNVMTTGNVSIKQNEWQSNDDNTNYEEFENNKILLPYTGETYENGVASDYNAKLIYPRGVDANDDGVGDEIYNQPYAFSTENNAIFKIVTVTNEGTLPAYIRTLFAFEIARDKDGNAINPSADGVDMLNYTMSAMSTGFKWTDVIIEVDGVEYVIGEYYYSNGSKLAANTTSHSSLNQIYLGSTVGNEWYEMFGEEYNILVLSQAAQTTGFEDAEDALDTAFADVVTDNTDEIQGWFEEYVEEAE